MSGGAQTQAIRTGRLVRVFIYCFLLVAVLFYLLPLAIMLVNSVKPLAEITGGNMANTGGNMAIVAGGVYILSGTATFNSCTISNNQAADVSPQPFP